MGWSTGRMKGIGLGIGLTAVPALLLTFGACTGSDAPGAGTSTVTDSAEVRIVTSAEPTAPGSISVGSEPTVTIGALEGDEHDNLSRVRDATRLPDGRIVFLNSGASEVQIRAPDGAWLETLGRRGEGPGEYSSPDWIQYHGDTIWVFDPFQSGGRLTMYRLDGTLIGSENPEVEGFGRPNPDGILPGGELVRVRDEGSIERGEFGHLTLTMHALRFPPSGDRVDTIVSAPGGEAFLEQQGIGITSWLLPFGRAPQRASSEGSIYLGNGAQPVVLKQGLAGEPPVSIRFVVPRQPLEDRHLERWVDGQLDNSFFDANPGRAGEYRERYATMPLPENLPVYSELLVDAAERLWVRRYALPWEPSNSWWVFDTEAIWLDTVSVPPGVRVLEIGEDYLMGVRTDELEIEYLEVYPVRPGRGVR